MSKTSKPLCLIVDDSLLAHAAEFQAFIAQGNTVHALSSITDGEELMKADLILSPRAWRMLPETVKYLPQAIKSARLDVYGPTKKKGG